MKKINFNNIKSAMRDGYEQVLFAVKVLYSDIKTRGLIAFALLLNVLIWAGSFFINFRVNAEVIALHHNIYFGITLIGSPKQVYLIPILGFLIIFINLIVSYIIQHKNNFFVYLFTSTSVAINFFLLLGIGSIVLINFR